MNPIQFDQFLEQLYLIFGRPMPANPKRIQLLFQELQHIPNSATNFILNKFKTEVNILPTNIIKTVGEFWNQYQNQYQNQYPIPSPKNKCNCHDGFILYTKIVDNQEHLFAAKCPKCNKPAA